jgi:cytochrome c-type biogenesis protein CcmF
VDPYNRTWTFTSQGVSRYEELNRQVVAVALDAKRAGAAPTLIKSEKRQHVDSRRQPLVRAVDGGRLSSSRCGRTCISCCTVSPAKGTAEIRITFNPLVWWVWYGGMIMALGGLIVMWPQATRAGANRRAEGGYVVVMQPTERPPVDAAV